MGNGTISLIIRTASPTALAWNPIPAMPSTSSATEMSRPWWSLNSIPRTSRAPSGMASEGMRTASLAVDGAAEESSFEGNIEVSFCVMVGSGGGLLLMGRIFLIVTFYLKTF